MGLILDSSVLIGAERKGQNARQALVDIASRVPGEDVAVSVITLAEMAHGVARANTPERKNVRRQFLDELMMVLPVHPVTASISLRVGGMDGERSSLHDDSRAGRGLVLTGGISAECRIDDVAKEFEPILLAGAFLEVEEDVS